MEYHYLQAGGARAARVVGLLAHQLAVERAGAVPEGAADAGDRDPWIWHGVDRYGDCRAVRCGPRTDPAFPDFSAYAADLRDVRIRDQRSSAEAGRDGHARVPNQRLSSRSLR